MDQPRPARKRRWRRTLLLLTPAFAGLLWYGSRAVGVVANYRAFAVPAVSMAPTILPGDRLLVNIEPNDPKRGEIWAFSGPNSTFIKRVIGLPGETVEVQGGRVLVDGKPLLEPYLSTPMTGAMAPVRLGPGQYFVMGDNRALSLDSRAFGPIHKGQFVGRAERRYWPSNRIGPVR